MSTNRKPKPGDEALVSFRAPRDLADRFRLLVEREERTVSQDLRRYMAERLAERPEREAA